jgi:hypothetical protein
MTVLAGIIGRHAKGMLAELGREDDCAAGLGDGRCFLEHGGDLGVGLVRGETKVTSPLDRIVDDGGGKSVRSSPFAPRQPLREGRREQRMREADRAVHVLEHLPGKGRFERVRNARRTEHGRRRTADRGDERQGLPRLFREIGEPAAYDTIQAVGHGEGLQGIDVCIQSPSQLERVERVSARNLVHTQERRSRERPSEPRPEKLVGRAEAQRADG